MKIAIIGYGKMGKEIEAIALNRGHEISARFNSANPVTPEKLLGTDVAIEFTRPELAAEHINFCTQADCPVVVGTTGWYHDFAAIETAVMNKKGALLYATNFSLGVNITFFLNEMLSKIMSYYPEYGASVTEIHHTKKLDAPSGTAITLAEGLLANTKKYNHWVLTPEAGNDKSLPITAIRENEVPGTHIIDYSSDIDSIELIHTAHSRKGFATGSVMAAEWLKDKKGVYSMRDMLNFDALI